MIERKHDWPERLAEFFADRADRAFVWGENDCCLFVCDAVVAMSGLDLAAAFRGQYSSERSAFQIFGGDLEGFISRIADENAIAEIPVAFAQRGDVALFSHPLPTLGVIDMHGTHVVSVGESGPVAIPLSECRKAWRVG
jgi:hypothetical protein